VETGSTPADRLTRHTASGTLAVSCVDRGMLPVLFHRICMLRRYLPMLSCGDRVNAGCRPSLGHSVQHSTPRSRNTTEERMNAKMWPLRLASLVRRAGPRGSESIRGSSLQLPSSTASTSWRCGGGHVRPQDDRPRTRLGTTSRVQQRPRLLASPVWEQTEGFCGGWSSSWPRRTSMASASCSCRWTPAGPYPRLATARSETARATTPLGPEPGRGDPQGSRTP